MTDGKQQQQAKDDVMFQVRSQNHRIAALIDSGEDFDILFIRNSGLNTCSAAVRVGCKIRNLIASNHNTVFIVLLMHIVFMTVSLLKGVINVKIMGSMLNHVKILLSVGFVVGITNHVTVILITILSTPQ